MNNKNQIIISLINYITEFHVAVVHKNIQMQGNHSWHAWTHPLCACPCLFGCNGNPSVAASRLKHCVPFDLMANYLGLQLFLQHQATKTSRKTPLLFLLLILCMVTQRLKVYKYIQACAFRKAVRQLTLEQELSAPLKLFYQSPLR